MSEPISFEKPEFHLIATDEQADASPSSDTPFRVALLGDFAGRAGRAANDAATTGRRPLEIDRDNFDDVIRKLGVELQMRLAGDAAAPVALRFEELDDFHPDRIYERLDLFRSLRQTRERLRDPATFDAAAAEVRSWAEADASDPVREPSGPAEPRPAPAADTSGRDLVEQMLGRTESAEASAERSSGPSAARPAELSDFGRFLSDAVKPHLVSVDEARQADLTDAVDAAAGHLMRAILHHRDFQALEAAWRATHFLVSRTETGTSLKLYLLDLTREELAASLGEQGGPRGAGGAPGSGVLHELFVEQPNAGADAEPWALLVGNYTFDHTPEDAELLGLAADIARKARAPFIAAASARAAGIESVFGTEDDDRPPSDSGEGAQAWDALRRLPEARYLGLVAPRFLLRLPFGEETEPAERFDFEEMDEGAPRHEDYLWGNPAFACAHLLAESFSRGGWDMRAGDVKEIEGLPLHFYEEQGETLTKPCAEVFLTERAAEAMMERGVMPLLSFKNSDAVRLARFQSLAEPAAPLAGRWS